MSLKCLTPHLTMQVMNNRFIPAFYALLGREDMLVEAAGCQIGNNQFIAKRIQFVTKKKYCPKKIIC